MSHYGTSIKARVHSLFSLRQIVHFYLHVRFCFFLFEQQIKYYAVRIIERPWPVEMKIARCSNR